MQIDAIECLCGAVVREETTGMSRPEESIPTSPNGALVANGRTSAGESEDAGTDVLNGATCTGESAAELLEIIRDRREFEDPSDARPDRVESRSKIP